ncbi:hypothetical protein [Mycoplasma sp. Ms02]|uniref:hypothetical protein n=1 Tax=Mycoplasma sp. Ms02 TaxID=353851 RepID=UPI001C891E4D|nr:hypothetical protein [Mycoplasma sp. Ms02]QZE12656.1 hypothetical protein K4L35_01570 [Mycoplasma sp. Ms02]
MPKKNQKNPSPFYFKKVQSKERKSKYIFYALSITAIIISSLTILLNLYSIRYNKFPIETMALFVAIAIITAVVTFIIALQSFLNITNFKNKIKDNLEKNQNALSQIEKAEYLTKEEVDSLTESL